jgi:uncharacterized protein YceK
MIFMLCGNREIFKNVSVSFWQGLEWKFYKRRLAKMKLKLISVLLIVMLAVAGCSSSGSKLSPTEEKIATINTLMSKGYEMSQNQRETINQLTADGNKLVSEGKTAEANKLFDEAIKLLEVIGETDRFNKSE